MKQRGGPITRGHCTVEARRLAKHFSTLLGDVHLISEVLYSHCSYDRVVTETVNDLLLNGSIPTPKIISEQAFRTKSRGPKKCTECDNVGWVSVDEDELTQGTRKPCPLCKSPAPKQARLFGGRA